MTHYFTGRSGDSFVTATLHARKDCDNLSEPIRPLADDSVPSDAGLCTACGPKGAEMHDGDKAQLIQEGICPWCKDEYTSVGRHAAAAHPDEWAEYSAD